VGRQRHERRRQLHFEDAARAERQQRDDPVRRDEPRRRGRPAARHRLAVRHQRTHARAVNERWAYKISAGGYTSDPLPRPTGAIPNSTGTQYPNYVNQGTTQPKFDTRVDYDAEKYKLVVAGGYSGTEGIFHTGIGPFDSDGVGIGYGTMRYTRGGLKFNFFTNILNGDATGLLAIGTNGQPILFQFDTQTYDFEAGNVNLIGTKNVLSYGGNVRLNSFDLSIAPRGDHRTEIGGYIQDEIFLHGKVRLNVGARIDKFDNIADPVFSPRIAAILKPSADQALRLSYNKAFRSPSLVNNYLDTTIVNQLNLGAINPALNGVVYNFPVRAIGKRGLSEEATQVVEVGYTGVIKNRATLSAAVYWSESQDEIFFTQTGRYRAAAPPPGWPLPPVVLEVLPPPCTAPPARPAACRRSSAIEPRHGEEQGLRARRRRRRQPGAERLRELFVSGRARAGLRHVGDQPAADQPLQRRLQLQPGHYPRQPVGELRRRCVFPGRARRALRGPTEAYTQVNGAFGVKFLRDKLQTTIKVINLLERGHPVARVRRHPEAPGDRRGAGDVLGGTSVLPFREAGSGSRAGLTLSNNEIAIADPLRSRAPVLFEIGESGAVLVDQVHDGFARHAVHRKVRLRRRCG
jgi:hypothetical protein